MGDSDWLIHHGSHRKLLLSPSRPESIAQAGPNAIVVPTVRRPAELAAAAKLALALNCTLVTLHSGRRTKAAQAWHLVPPDVDLIAVDVPASGSLHLPRWETSQILAEARFSRRTDQSAKRNLALMLGRMIGWSRIFFLDDDIIGLDPDDIR